uniref:Uncharacterized protein n=1 Tax=Solanum lycopersicum TaxID=4081 RepID=A0A3Q7G1F9_SOLLC
MVASLSREIPYPAPYSERNGVLKVCFLAKFGIRAVRKWGSLVIFSSIGDLSFTKGKEVNLEAV